MVDVIFPASVTLLEELLVGADPEQDLHLILDSPGGDGETAVRLVRSAQARCRELTVIVPDQAKSAGTILVMGAHRILMGPTSDLGPVDPQFQSPSGPGLYSAKDLIAAVENADAAIAANPDSYPLHVSLLADVTAVMVQQARSALARTDDLVREALASNPDRTADEVETIAQALKEKLIDLPQDHGAVFDAAAAREAGLPVATVDPNGDQWRLVWQLWAKYFQLSQRVYEGRYASQELPWNVDPGAHQLGGRKPQL
jgi:membrane-bound ClpP family serine protease